MYATIRPGCRRQATSSSGELLYPRFWISHDSVHLADGPGTIRIVIMGVLPDGARGLGTTHPCGDDSFFLLDSRDFSGISRQLSFSQRLRRVRSGPAIIGNLR